jgi:hypothetical protein
MNKQNILEGFDKFYYFSVALWSFSLFEKHIGAKGEWKNRNQEFSQLTNRKKGTPANSNKYNFSQMFSTTACLENCKDDSSSEAHLQGSKTSRTSNYPFLSKYLNSIS